MAGGWFIGSRYSNVRSYGTVAASTTMTIATTGAAHTKGSYVQLTASTVGDCSAIIVHGPRCPAASSNASADIAIGGAGSEQIIIPDIMVDAPGTVIVSQIFPIAIPNGTRIAARAQAQSASSSVQVAVTLLGDGVMGRSGGVVDVIGFVAAATTGSTINAGGTANTKGAYTQLIAATAEDYSAFCFFVDILGLTTRSAGSQHLLDIAIGGAGSEIIIVPDFPLNGLFSPDCIKPCWSPWFEMEIPVGTRIAARAQCTTTTSVNRVNGLTLYALRG